MKVEKQIETKIPLDLKIKEITLLSCDEAARIGEKLRNCGEYWWLRSPGDKPCLALYVDEFGTMSVYGDYASYACYGIRPALKVENPESTGIKEGDKIQIAGVMWTVIQDGIILCDDIVDKSVFRADEDAENVNDYEKSDVKKALHHWAEAAGIKVTN